MKRRRRGRQERSGLSPCSVRFILPPIIHGPEKALMYQRFIRRVLDILLAVFAEIVLAPLMVATPLVVRATLGSPVLFRQVLPVRNGAPFTILKFRNIRAAHDSENDAARLTSVGRLLRSLSLDELPELFNVLTG